MDLYARDYLVRAGIISIEAAALLALRFLH